jgi:hypothetical protein
LEQLLTDTGFSLIEGYADQPAVYGLASGLCWLLWRLLRVGLRLYWAVESGSLAREEICSQNLFCAAIK